MILLAALLATMPLADWNEMSPTDRQRLGMFLGREYLQMERDCFKVRITFVREDENVLFEAECIEARKTNI